MSIRLKDEAALQAASATKLKTARTIALSGDVTGSATFDGSANATITATVADDSHNHIIANVDGLQTALDAKANLASPAMTGTPTAPTASAGTNSTQVATTAFVTTAIANKTSVSGNAGTATKLQTARTINGVSFDGTANITVADSTKVPLSGGTMTGRLTANGKVSAPTTAGSWISGMTVTNAAIGISTQQTTSSYHPVLAVKTSGNHVVNLGGLGDNFGFYGYKSGRTENATDWSVVMNATNGRLTSSGGFSGSLSGNASTATTLQTARTINGTSFNGSANITTANWGTARTLTIGNSGKSVNGSANVSWSLAEIGALPLAGGTISSTSFGPLVVQRSGSTNGAGIGFGNSNGVLGYIGMTGGVNGGLLRYSADTNTSYNVLDSGNFKTYVTPAAIGAVGTASPAFTGTPTAPTAAAGNNTTQLATTAFVTTAVNNKTSVSGNAGTATALQTARTINGTSFNGTANITTANWGTARTLTVGNTGKSVNGSGNVSWSLAEIGAAPISHEQDYAGTGTNTFIAYPKDGRYRTNTNAHTGYLKITLPQTWTNTMMKFEVDVYNYVNNETSTYMLAGYNYASTPGWNSYSACCISHSGNSKRNLTVRFGHDGTKCAIYIGEASTVWSYCQITVKNITVGYSSYELSKWNSGWSVGVTTTLGTITGTVTNPFVGNGGMASTANTLATARTINGTSFNGSANITTANWGTARTLTIGNTGKSVNGSANVSWSLSEMGAVANSEGVASNLSVAKYLKFADYDDGTATTVSTYLRDGIWYTGFSQINATKFQGAFNATGGIQMNGHAINLTTANSSYPKIGYEASSEDTYISNAANNWLRLKKDGSITWKGSKVYHAGDKPTAADVKALPLTGGTMTGTITTGAVQRDSRLTTGNTQVYNVATAGNKLYFGNPATPVQVEGSTLTFSGAATFSSTVQSSGGFHCSGNGLYNAKTGYCVVRSETGGIVYLQGGEVRATEPNTTGTYVPFRAGKIYCGNVWMNGANSIRNDSRELYLAGTSESYPDYLGSMGVSSDSAGGRFYSASIYNRKYTASANMHVTSAGTVGYTSSARRYKLDIKSVEADKPERILDLEPRTWFDKTATEQYASYLTMKAKGRSVDLEFEDIPYMDRQNGLIAEEVEDVGLSQFVNYGDPDEEGNREVMGVQYDRLWTLLIPVVRDQRETISELKDMVREQQAQINELKELLQSKVA